MKLFRTPRGTVLELDGHRFEVSLGLDDWFADRVPPGWRDGLTETVEDVAPLAPLASQEVWAAGVTYRRSREARMEESEREADVYDRVYEAERPELFLQSDSAPRGGRRRLGPHPAGLRLERAGSGARA